MRPLAAGYNDLSFAGQVGDGTRDDARGEDDLNLTYRSLAALRSHIGIHRNTLTTARAS
ncbi:MAG TPA: hypothetical protein VFE59_33485 [Trebonia sp.]|nr:hypothetical protein [Trebonia sp.]